MINKIEIIMLLVCTLMFPLDAFSASEDYRVWLSDLKQEMLSRGINEEFFDKVYSVDYYEEKPEVLQKDKKMVEFVPISDEYLNKIVTKSRVLEARKKYKYVREKYENLANSQGAELLHMRLAENDPESAARLHKNDVRRVVRALEIFDLTGKPASEIFRDGEKKDFGFDILYVGLSSKEELFNLRFQHATGQLENPVKMRELKRDIARVKTVIKEKDLAKVSD